MCGASGSHSSLSACCGQAFVLFPVSRRFRLCRVRLPMCVPGADPGEHLPGPQHVFTSTGCCQMPPGARSAEEPRNGLEKSKVQLCVWCAAVYFFLSSEAPVCACACVHIDTHTGMHKLSENNRISSRGDSTAELGQSRRAPTCQCLPFSATDF